MTSTAPRSPAPRPEVIGPYAIVEAIGAGGMGVVYRARHLANGQVVALKTVQAQGEAVLAGIRREIHALRTLEHPGVVRIVADGLDRGLPWYAMELLEGPTLRRFHRERSATPSPDDPPSYTTSSTGTATTLRGAAATARGAGASGPASTRAGLPLLKEALGAMRAVCSTLAFVHGRGIVHRDLKPDNVILTVDRGPVIVDFGIAARGLGARGREVLHASGRAMGSPGYMAPEQILGEIVDARADLYAIGCMLFESITGRLPFDSESSLHVLARKLHEEAPSVRTLAPDIPDALERLVARLLSRRPQDRVGHADDVAAILTTLGAAWATPEGPAAEPYLYRPGLAGRRDAMDAIERVLVAASVSRVQSADEPPAWQPPSTGAYPVPFTAAGPTLDVTSGRDLAADRRGGFVLVGGESGVGKTRLALEVIPLAAQRGFRVVTGQCERVGAGAEGAAALRAAPLHPLRDLFHAIADRCRAGGRPAYQAILGTRGPVLAAFEPTLADLDGHTDQPALVELPPDAARTRLHEALSETLRAYAATEPLLLVLDDLQWADEHTLGFLRWLDEAWFDGSPVVVLATYRLEEVSPALAALVGRRGVRVEKLLRLDERAVARIVRDMLAVDAPDPGLVGYLHRHTEGNPFFVAEYLRTAIDRKLLLRDEAGRWHVDAAATAGGEMERLPLPATLAELVALRLDGLDASALAIARMLAVLGREAQASVLADALGEPELSPEGMLELLVGDVVDEPQPDVVRFVHDKLREVVYARLAPPERAALHRRAAAALARFAEARGEEDRLAPELAHHHAEAGDVARALAYLDQAAERAMATGAASDALRSFELAARLHDDRADAATRHALGPRRVRWERRAAEAHHALGELRAAEARGRAALRLATGRPTLLDVAHEESGATRARFAVGAAWAVGRQLIELARGSERAAGDGSDVRWREAALAAEKLAQTYLFLNEASRAGLASVLAANFAARFGASPELARGHAQLAIASAYLPSDRLARAYVARADRIARRVADPETDCSVDFMCGYASLGAGRFGACRARLDAALERARALRDRRREEEALALLGMTATFQGRFDEALGRYAELELSARRSHNAQGRMWAHGGRGMVWARLGRIDETIAAFEDLGSLVDATSDQSERIQIGLSAVHHLLRGDRARSRAVAESTLSLLEAAPPAGCQILPGVEGSCTALLALWTSAPPGPERRALEPLAERAVASAEAFARYFPIGLPDALRLRAAWLAAHGRLRRVEPTLRRSIEAAMHLGMPIEEGRARVALAARLAGPARAEELRRGRELLRAARAHLYLRGDVA